MAARAPLSGGGGLGDADLAAVILGVFDHHNAVRTPGHGTAGGDGHTFLGIQVEFRALAHKDLALQGQDGGDGVGTAEGIPCPDRIAVHGGTVKIGHIFGGGDVLRQHPAHGLGQGDQLRPGCGSKFSFNQSQNFFRRFHMEHDYTSQMILPRSR